jgi:hypothetical protein
MDIEISKIIAEVEKGGYSITNVSYNNELDYDYNHTGFVVAEESGVKTLTIKFQDKQGD